FQGTQFGVHPAEPVPFGGGLAERLDQHRVSAPARLGNGGNARVNRAVSAAGCAAPGCGTGCLDAVVAPVLWGPRDGACLRGDAPDGWPGVAEPGGGWSSTPCDRM